jgi:C1A family cysteine protease
MENEIFEPGGYPIDDERRDELQRLPGEQDVLALVGTYTEVRFDPRQILKVESQGSQGACAGHSLTTVMEFCHALSSGTIGMQLSRAAGYYESQRLSGIRGDRGSLISDGVKLAKNSGICEERLWPYPSRYDPTRPRNWAEVQENALQYRIGRATNITTYEGFRAFLGSGQGGIHIGIGWGSGMSRAVVESYSSGGGGHAIAGLCLSERVDSNGDPFAFIMNSWGTNVGSGGWHEWSPRAIRQMLQSSRTSMVGLSDMPHVKPREISLDQIKKKLRV